MKNLFKQIKDLYRIDPMVVINGKVYYKSNGEKIMERVVQIVFTFGILGIISVIERLIFNF